MQRLSNLGWAMVGQLAKQPYFDGDLVSKDGRDELIAAGLAERVPMYGTSPGGVMENRLTKKGVELAAKLSDGGRA